MAVKCFLSIAHHQTNSFYLWTDEWFFLSQHGPSHYSYHTHLNHFRKCWVLCPSDDKLFSNSPHRSPPMSLYRWRRNFEFCCHCQGISPASFFAALSSLRLSSEHTYSDTLATATFKHHIQRSWDTFLGWAWIPPSLKLPTYSTASTSCEYFIGSKSEIILIHSWGALICLGLLGGPCLH